MTDTDHYFISRAEQQQLTELLDTIPALVEDLAVTVSRQDRLGNGPRISRGKQAQPLPYNVNASEAADNLHWELTQWVRAVCDQRQLTYDGRNDTISLARWLKRWIIALALTEGAETALIDIEGAIFDARRAIDIPTERPRPQPDPTKVTQADNLELNPRGIATLAKEMGGPYKGLTQRRVHYLNETGAITPLRREGRISIYRVGDVRQAHLTRLVEQDIA